MSSKPPPPLGVIPRGTVIMCVFLCSFNDTVTKDIFPLNSMTMALEQWRIVFKGLPSTDLPVQYIPGRAGGGSGRIFTLK